MSASASAIESNEIHHRADDREQAHLGAAAERPAGLHADAADRRHAVHADDVRRDRLLRHARVGRQRLAVRARQPDRQQRVPASKGPRARAPAAAPATGTTRHRSTRSRSSRFSTSSVDASYGRTSGGVVNMTLRSGTNQLRGSGIMLHRGTWLDANQIQNIRNNISNEGHKYYNAKGMVSGPIRRGKTFFMGGYQGFYENIPFPVTRTVPTDAATAGRLLADLHRQRTADSDLRPADDEAATRRAPVHPRPVPGQHRSGEIAGIRSRGRCSSTFRRANATPSNLAGADNFVNSPNLGRYRYNSYLTPLDHVFSDPPAVAHEHGELGHRVPQRKRPARAGDPERQLPDAPQPLPADGGRQRHDQSDDALEHAPVVGSIRRAARQSRTATSSRSCRSRGPTS